MDDKRILEKMKSVFIDVGFIAVMFNGVKFSFGELEVKDE